MVKNLRAMQETCTRHGFDSLVRKIPWRRKWQPTPVLLPGRSHGQRSLVGYSPWGCKMSDMTERLNSNNNNSTERKMYFWASQKISVTCWYSARSKDHKFKWWGCVFTDFLEPSSFGLDTLLPSLSSQENSLEEIISGYEKWDSHTKFENIHVHPRGGILAESDAS